MLHITEGEVKGQGKFKKITIQKRIAFGYNITEAILRNNRGFVN
jgi:hypothetical protein